MFDNGLIRLGWWSAEGGELPLRPPLGSHGIQPAEHHIERFVLGLVHTGAMLSRLVSDLTAALPTHGYPGEEPRAVVVEMLCGTIGTGLRSVDPRDVERATELVDLTAERTLEHLRLARELAQRIHGDGDGAGRTYG